MIGFLKNYTSNVPVSQTIYRIEQVLIRCGVSGIMKEYAGTNGEIAAITFKIETATGPIAIRLPANKAKAQEALWLDYVGGERLNDKGDQIRWNSRKKKSKSDFDQQAERTAWKLVQDWIEVQMSMIQMKQAETEQVFMPYMWNGQETLYQKLKAVGFKQLTNGNP